MSAQLQGMCRLQAPWGCSRSACRPQENCRPAGRRTAWQSVANPPLAQTVPDVLLPSGAARKQCALCLPAQGFMHTSTWALQPLGGTCTALRGELGAGGVSGVWLLEEFADLQATVRESQCRPALQLILDDVFQVCPPGGQLTQGCSCSLPSAGTLAAQWGSASCAASVGCAVTGGCCAGGGGPYHARADPPAGAADAQVQRQAAGGDGPLALALRREG